MTQDILAAQMYQEHILDLYAHPHNTGHLECPTHRCKRDNPLCGDSIEIEVIVAKGVIDAIRIRPKGCAISVAAASLLSDTVIGKRVEDVKQLGSDDIISLLGVPISQPRMSCATLALTALQQALSKEE